MRQIFTYFLCLTKLVTFSIYDFLFLYLNPKTMRLAKFWAKSFLLNSLFRLFLCRISKLCKLVLVNVLLFKAEIHLIVYLKLRKDHNNENKRKFWTETSFKKLMFVKTLGWNEREEREFESRKRVHSFLRMLLRIYYVFF